ncbi:hypothetical protein B7494_g953 [Chlorociboria aeruginascens]|nr:hypothetical protein B7494_g953 [Chlorociboria aeruginascens]
MPADYPSTAKALALPVSPLESPSSERQNNEPPWSRRLSSTTRRANNASPYSQTPLSMWEQALLRADRLQRKAISVFMKLTLLQKILAVVGLTVSFAFGILFLIFSERIFGWLAPVAENWRDLRGGWMILWALTFISAFPPLIGYSTTLTIGGFVYGFPNGWFVVASATVVGSLASFVASRTVLSGYVHRLVGKDKRFEALALTLKTDGLKILVMIRICPLPYSLSNAAMSTFPTVHPLSYALATLLVSPKLLIHVFIGSRLASLAENGGKMDAGTKAINYLSIIIGGALGTGVGYIIYSRTMARAKQLELEAQEAARAEGGAGRTIYNDEGTEDADAADLMNDDDISLWDNDDANIGYRDESDGDEDVSAAGDEEAAIGGKKIQK